MIPMPSKIFDTSKVIIKVKNNFGEILYNVIKKKTSY